MTVTSLQPQVATSPVHPPPTSQGHPSACLGHFRLHPRSQAGKKIHLLGTTPTSEPGGSAGTRAALGLFFRTSGPAGRVGPSPFLPVLEPSLQNCFSNSDPKFQDRPLIPRDSQNTLKDVASAVPTCWSATQPHPPSISSGSPDPHAPSAPATSGRRKTARGPGTQVATERCSDLKPESAGDSRLRSSLVLSATGTFPAWGSGLGPSSP